MPTAPIDMEWVLALWKEAGPKAADVGGLGAY